MGTRFKEISTQDLKKAVELDWVKAIFNQSVTNTEIIVAMRE
jgi:hypothetical protein